RAQLQRYLGDLRSGNAGKPVFSTLLFEWVQDAWIYASAELQEQNVRSASLLVRLVQSPSRYLPGELPLLDRLPREELRTNLQTITAASIESRASVASSAGAGAGGAGAEGRPGATQGLGKPDGPLAKFTSDLTARAKAGEIDPIFGRE